MPLPRALFPSTPRPPIVFTVDGLPPRKNRRHTAVSIPKKGTHKCKTCETFDTHANIVDHPDYEAFVERLRESWYGEVIDQVNAGRWQITVRSFFSGAVQRDLLFPKGDSDASTSAVLDALQEVGAIDNDVRVVRSTGESDVDPHRPRVEIRLEQIGDDG